jgi:aryl-alcohol dehydrogenase-like predicted oxidoreductase
MRVSAADFFTKDYNMHYRRLGAAGLKLSELSFGSWVTFNLNRAVKAERNGAAAQKHKVF